MLLVSGRFRAGDPSPYWSAQRPPGSNSSQQSEVLNKWELSSRGKCCINIIIEETIMWTTVSLWGCWLWVLFYHFTLYSHNKMEQLLPGGTWDNKSRYGSWELMDSTVRNLSGHFPEIGQERNFFSPAHSEEYQGFPKTRRNPKSLGCASGSFHGGLCQ